MKLNVKRGNSSLSFPPYKLKATGSILGDGTPKFALDGYTYVPKTNYENASGVER